MQTLLIYLATVGFVRDVFCLVHWEVLGLSTSYSSQQADPIRDDQSDMPSSLCKSGKKKFGYLFIWTVIDHSSAFLIGCCKQPLKCTALSILVICKDISTFLAYGLFVIIHLHSSCLPV